ncbi:hypothetical protein NMY22_g15289 [Coprinellus aureogranulatus]|nr:hypothetical protein NMY22_g15289 [Coprinellus aureogranulatus]
MDSFTTIFFNKTSTTKGAPVDIPSEEEKNSGQTGGNYCVVFAREPEVQLPADEEKNSGQTGGNYCTIA